MARKISVFWSWQADSPGKVGRHFVKDCLVTACSEIDADASDAVREDDDDGGLMVVKDTEGVGGSPAIASTILARIAASDVFVWDATIIAASPRMMPNPNVFFELGYAVACLGWSRVVGVTNHALSLSSRAEDLPFDVRHHRAPLAYSLAKAASKRDIEKASKTLSVELKRAISAALNEPKQGIVAHTADRDRVRRIVTAADAKAVRYTLDYLRAEPSRWPRVILKSIERLLDAIDRVENQVGNNSLQAALGELLQAGVDLLDLININYFVDNYDESMMVIQAKASRRMVPDYHQKLQTQVDAVKPAIGSLRDAWATFVKVALDHHPEIGDIFD